MCADRGGDSRLQVGNAIGGVDVEGDGVSVADEDLNFPLQAREECCERAVSGRAMGSSIEGREGVERVHQEKRGSRLAEQKGWVPYPNVAFVGGSAAKTVRAAVGVASTA